MQNSTKGKPVMVCFLSGLDKFRFSGVIFKAISTPFQVLCIANEYASNANPLVWYFLNGAFGMVDLFCFPHSCASALSWHSPSKPASSLVWLIANTQTRMCPFGPLLKQFSKQDLLPPCSINKIHKTLYSIRSMIAGWGGI